MPMYQIINFGHVRFYLARGVRIQKPALIFIVDSLVLQYATKGRRPILVSLCFAILRVFSSWFRFGCFANPEFSKHLRYITTDTINRAKKNRRSLTMMAAVSFAREVSKNPLKFSFAASIFRELSMNHLRHSQHNAAAAAADERSMFSPVSP